ncbi:MAG: SRPBCC domain-containing protein [Ignavibacteria bacterium]
MDLTLEKEINSSQQSCYHAFTDPEHLSVWFTTNAKSDLKPGGSYDQREKHQKIIYGEYTGKKIS